MKLVFILAALLVAGISNAETKLTSATEVVSQNKDNKEGWVPSLSLGVSGQFTSNENYVGQLEGQNITLGGNVSSGLGYFSGLHEWTQTLNLKLAYSKTPTVENYLKTADELKYESVYLYSLESMPWMGPYFKVSASTAIFFGEDVQAASTVYTKADGTVIKPGTDLRLTDGFSPLTLKESVGFFAKVIDEKAQKLQFRLGFGAIQVVNADDQRVMDGKNANGSLKTKTLADYDEAGIEFGATYSGTLDTKTSYLLTLETLTPIINDDKLDRSAFELTSMEFLGALNTKVYDAISLTYELKVKNQPQLVEGFQVQNMFLINFNYSIL